MTNPWIEAMRLRTLPVSIAGVLGGTGCAAWHHGFKLIPMLICLVFALCAQIASNFANEYYDYKNGIDRQGRDGFRRGVTEGDIKPAQMKRATFMMLGFACLLGCSLIYYGGWWLIAVGAVIAVFALAYSGGPYPLSQHGLGDVAVLLFYGLVPVLFTQYVQTGIFYTDRVSWCVAVGIGLLGINVLIVNNYRDRDDDVAVNKRTTVVILGRKVMRVVYLANGFIGSLLIAVASPGAGNNWAILIVAVFVWGYGMMFSKLGTETGAALNKVLKTTALLLLGCSAWGLVTMCVWPQ